MICRTDPDYYRAFNCLALAAHQTDSSIIAEAIMSNHIHVCARSNDISTFIKNFRYAYCRYFNKKYYRRGSLGEKNCFISEIEGFHHFLTAICYVLRNSVHHGVTSTPFGYRHCSANALFMKDLGQTPQQQNLKIQAYYKYLPRDAEFPSKFKMSSEGVFRRESVLDIADAEHYFGTARSYMYYMNRLSSEEWTKEQEKDMNGKSYITLNTIEAPYQDDSCAIQNMIHNEHGRNIMRVSDIDLCTLIDTQFLPSIGKESIFQLNDTQRNRLMQRLRSELHCPEKQLRRCIF